MIAQCIMVIKEVLIMISNTLRKVRNERGMSVSELARRASTSRQTITNIELYGQNPNGLLMLRICQALGKKPEDIFFTHRANRG